MRVHFDGLRRPARVAKALRSELKALGVTLGLGRAQDLVALGFGYASYKELQAVTAQASTKPDPWDEDVDPRTAASRRARQAEAYTGAGIDAATAAAIVGRIGPSARNVGSVALRPRASRGGTDDGGRVEVLTFVSEEAFTSHAGNQAILAGLTHATASRSIDPGAEAAYLDNGWLLHSGLEKDARQLALTFAAGGHPVERVVLIHPYFVAAFREPLGAKLDREVLDLIGNPSARDLLRTMMLAGHGRKASAISVTRAGAVFRVDAEIQGNRERFMEIDTEAARALTNECWRLALSRVARNRSPPPASAGRASTRS